MQTQQKVPTPMSRIKVQMIAIRKEMARLGFRQVVLNQAKGHYYDGSTLGVVKSDYTEFFSTKDIVLTDKEQKLEKDLNIQYFETWGFSFFYKDLAKTEQTVKIQYKKRTKFRDNYKNLITNDTIKSKESPSISVEMFLKHLPELVAKVKMAKTKEDVFSFVRKLVSDLT